MKPHLVAHQGAESVSSAPPSSGDDSALVALAQRGDVDAFRSLHAKTADHIMAICSRMTGDKQRGAELTHDSFVRAWERLHTFRGDSSFSTWMHRVAVNVVLSATRAEQRRVDREQADPQIVDGRGGAHVAPADVGERIDLERAISRLPTNARLVFVLHDVEGYRHDEIAAMMDLAGGTVRAHLHRARQLLMQFLTR